MSAITFDGTNFWVARGAAAGSKVYEVAADGSVLSSFSFDTRIAGLSYDPVNDHLLATSGNASDQIFVIGSIPGPASLSLLASGGLLAFRRRR